MIFKRSMIVNSNISWNLNLDSMKKELSILISDTSDYDNLIDCEKENGRKMTLNFKGLINVKSFLKVLKFIIKKSDSNLQTDMTIEVEDKTVSFETTIANKCTVEVVRNNGVGVSNVLRISELRYIVEFIEMGIEEDLC